MKRKGDTDNADDNDQRDKETKEPLVAKRSRRYNYTIKDLQQKLKLAEYSSAGELHISRYTHPFPIVIIDRLLYDLCDVDNPPTESDVDPQRVQLIVEILWQLIRCQNRVYTARLHVDDSKFPSIGIMFRRNRFYQRLAYVARLPGISVYTHATIARILALCTTSTPARLRLIRTREVIELFAVFLSSRADGKDTASELERDEAVLRCLLTCRGHLDQIKGPILDHILVSIGQRIKRWEEAPRIFQMACALLVCASRHRFDSMMAMPALLAQVIQVATGPQAHDIKSVCPVLGLVRVLVSRSTPLGTLTLLANTAVLQLLTNVITSESSDEVSLISALISISNLCYDLTVANGDVRNKEQLAALGPPLLTLAYVSPIELVRFESFVALFMLIQLLNVHTLDQTAYLKPWNALLDWETFGSCAFAHLEANLRSEPPDFGVCLAAISATWIVIVRLGSCDWLQPSIQDWTRLLAEISAPPFQPITLEDATDDVIAAMPREPTNDACEQVRCTASSLSRIIFAYQSLALDSTPIDSLLV